jgi:putative ABC transport system permease protein
MDHIEGDLLEEYTKRLSENGKRKADINFMIDVLLLFRRGIIRPPKRYSLSTYGMYKSYFKIGWRNLAKNKGYSVINIAGLAIGLACCLSIGLYIQDEYSYDRFHKNGANIYRVVQHQTKQGVVYDLASTPGPLAGAIKKDFAEVVDVCRIRRVSGIFKIGEKVVEPEALKLVDNSFFRIFDFELLSGNPDKVLQRPDEVVISEDVAEKIFGADWKNSKELLGHPVLYNNRQPLTLSGVVKNPPANSHIQFDVLLSMSMEEPQSYYHWDNHNYHTYALLNHDANTIDLDNKLDPYFLKQFSYSFQNTLSLQPLYDIYLHSNFAYLTDWGKTGNIVYIRIFLAVGIMVLLIAVFNFINLSTARASQRAKEVGVRKVVGAAQRQLIVQFLSESAIITFMAVAFAIVLTQLTLPVLNDITGKSLLLLTSDPLFFLGIIGFSVMVSLMAGLYPAFYISRFRPAKVLKGLFTGQSKDFFRQSLVVCQFTFSIILITGSIVVYKQLRYMQDRDLGFDRSHLLYVKMKNKVLDKARVIKSELENQGSIRHVAATSANLIEINNSTFGISWEGQEAGDKFEVTQLNVDDDFIETADMKIVAGRDFDINRSSDTTSYVINETAAIRMGWTPTEAVGKSVKLWDAEGTVIGVVKDFHFKRLAKLIEPVIFRRWPKGGYSGVLVRTKPGLNHEAIAAIEQVYKKHEDQAALHYEFVDQSLENQYRAEQNTGRIIFYFSGLSVFVSCLGLLGLATYTAQQRVKEISIRKVLGAGVRSIVGLLSNDFLKLVVVALFTAIPLSWWIMSDWLDDFAYRIAVEWWMFAVSGLGAIVIASLTVIWQSVKSAIANPINSLKSE